MSRSKQPAATPESEPSRIREGLPFPLGATWDGLGAVSYTHLTLPTKA